MSSKSSDDGQSRKDNPWTSVQLVLTDADSDEDVSVKLEVGRRYAIFTVNERREPVESRLVGDRKYSADGWTIPVGESGVRRALHTLPEKLVEVAPSRVIATFVELD